MFTLELGKDIIAAKVPFYPSVYPTMEITFRSDYEYPDRDEYMFERRRDLWFAEHPTGQVRFYSHPGDDRDHGGFCGAHFSLKMVDGSTQVLKGPWSSNSVAMNAAGFTPSMPCSFKGARQGYHLSGHVTRELWLAIYRHFDVQACIWSTKNGHEWALTKTEDGYRYHTLTERVDPATFAEAA